MAHASSLIPAPTNPADVKLNLQETDYGNFLQNEASPVLPAVVERCCRDKWVEEFNYIRAASTGPLAEFMDFIAAEYMIDNVLLLLKGTLVTPDVDPRVLIAKCHPLGRFDDGTLKSICAFENSARGYEELYTTVLIDTPVGRYFELYLQDQMAKRAVEGAAEVRSVLEEVPISTLENTVKKLYLEDFYAFCKSLGGETELVMGTILKARADAITISITLNSFDTFYNQPSHRTSSRRALYPSFGALYPEGIEALTRVEDEDGVSRVLERYPDYRRLWDDAPVDPDEGKQIDNAFFERNVLLCELAFEGQFHYGMFYAYVKLKEQEARNVRLICEMVVQGRRSESTKVVPVFSKSSWWRMLAHRY